MTTSPTGRDLDRDIYQHGYTATGETWAVDIDHDPATTLVITGADFGDIEARVLAWQQAGNDLRTVVIDGLAAVGMAFERAGRHMYLLADEVFKVVAAPSVVVERNAEPWYMPKRRKTFKRNRRRQMKKG